MSSRCKTCSNFERGKWHKTLGGDYQTGGYCTLLLEILKLENSGLAFIKKLYIQDTFGCLLHMKKEVSDVERKR